MLCYVMLCYAILSAHFRKTETVGHAVSGGYASQGSAAREAGAKAEGLKFFIKQRNHTTNKP